MALDYPRDPLVVLDELGITEPEEIILEAIAYHCGAVIMRQPLSGCEGRLLGNGDRAIITVNASSSDARQRFSAAHELGHWVRHRGRLAHYCTAEMIAWGRPQKNAEAEANRFAADLLMPDYMFRPRAAQRPIVFDTVRELARTFRTSLTSTAIRLVERGSFPAMALCCSAKSREWFVRGEDVPERLFPVRQPGKYTIAHRLLSGGIGTIGAEAVCAAEWFDHEDAYRYSVVEDSVEIRPGLVLTLLWWKDESQLLAIDED